MYAPHGGRGMISHYISWIWMGMEVSPSTVRQGGGRGGQMAALHRD